MAVPPKLKAIQSFMKVASDYDKRDAVVAYYCRMYAVQKGITIDSKSPDSKGYLLNLMDTLEQTKKKLSADGNEAVTNDIVGSSHVENKALALFAWADAEDRKANFSSGIVRAFYSSNLLFEVLKQFGAQSDEIVIKQKYAKWKATYINKCLQSGETPVPGPQGSEFEDELSIFQDASGDSSLPYPTSSGNPLYPPPSQPSQPPTSYPSHPTNSTPPSQHKPKPSQPTESYTNYNESPSSASGASYSVPVDFMQATKLCKYAISALQYEDVPTAITNLEKALAMLKT